MPSPKQSQKNAPPPLAARERLCKLLLIAQIYVPRGLAPLGYNEECRRLWRSVFAGKWLLTSDEYERALQELSAMVSLQNFTHGVIEEHYEVLRRAGRILAAADQEARALGLITTA
jgi:hypothetical protein